jgi:hypothetical protein
MTVCLTAVCCSIWSVHAEGEARVDGQTVADALKRGDLAFVDAAFARREHDWRASSGTEYFEDTRAILLEVARYVRLNPPLFPRLIEYASAPIAKSASPRVKDRSGMYFSQLKVLLELVSLVEDKRLQADPAWQANRSHVVRLGAIFCSAVRGQHIPDFKPFDVTINVMAEGYGAGVDPASIPDLQARAAYEAAIVENGRRAMINSEQGCLDVIVKDELPRFEQAIVNVYSVGTTDFLEVNEYLILSRVGPKDRERLIQRISENTGKPIPVGITSLNSE